MDSAERLLMLLLIPVFIPPVPAPPFTDTFEPVLACDLTLGFVLLFRLLPELMAASAVFFALTSAFVIILVPDSRVFLVDPFTLVSIDAFDSALLCLVSTLPFEPACIRADVL